MFNSDCRQADLWMAEFSAGLLEPADGLRLQDHLDRCPSCRRRRARISTLVEILRSDKAVLPPERMSLIERSIRQAPVLAAPTPVLASRPRWLLAAAILLMASLAVAASRFVGGLLPEEEKNTIPFSQPASQEAEPPLPQSAPVQFVEGPLFGGVVSQAGENVLELTVESGGEVRVYPYTLEGEPLPLEEVELPPVEIGAQKKTYRVTLAPEPEKGYFAGHLNTRVTFSPRTELHIRYTGPITIAGVRYPQEVVVYPVYVVRQPIIILPSLPPQQTIAPIRIGIEVRGAPKIKYKKYKR